ncbi:hypothetical protein [Brevundimonas sp.]|nr:hypothetical protein [Brevundimonas sp.]MDZ4364494.1 hypothetical protein [Brevundimonas sp.]
MPIAIVPIGLGAAGAAGVFAMSKIGFDMEYAPARERGGPISVQAI